MVYQGDESGGGTTMGRLTLTLGPKPVNSLVMSGGGKSSKAALHFEDVVVTIPFPKAVRTANLSVTAGSCLYDEATKVRRGTTTTRRQSRQGPGRQAGMWDTGRSSSSAVREGQDGGGH